MKQEEAYLPVSDRLGAGLEEEAAELRRAGAGRARQRPPARGVDSVGVGARREQQLHDRRPPGQRRRDERRGGLRRRPHGLGARPLLQQRPHDLRALRLRRLRHEDQRRAAVRRGAVQGGAVLAEPAGAGRGAGLV